MCPRLIFLSTLIIFLISIRFFIIMLRVVITRMGVTAPWVRLAYPGVITFTSSAAFWAMSVLIMFSLLPSVVSLLPILALLPVAVPLLIVPASATPHVAGVLAVARVEIAAEGLFTGVGGAKKAPPLGQIRQRHGVVTGRTHQFYSFPSLAPHNSHQC